MRAAAAGVVPVGVPAFASSVRAGGRPLAAPPPPAFRPNSLVVHITVCQPVPRGSRERAPRGRFLAARRGAASPRRDGVRPGDWARAVRRLRRRADRAVREGLPVQPSSAVGDAAQVVADDLREDALPVDTRAKPASSSAASSSIGRCWAKSQEDDGPVGVGAVTPARARCRPSASAQASLAGCAAAKPRPCGTPRAPSTPPGPTKGIVGRPRTAPSAVITESPCT